MLFIYDKQGRSISSCKETSLKEHKLLERHDLEKWVEKCPEILGEELLILTTEYDRFDKTNERLDLLALDKEGNLVIVELKRADSGKHVDLQAVKYAAYCSTLRLDDVVALYCHYVKKNDKEKARQELLDFIENEEFEEIPDKPRVILVSRDFRSEVTATVLWLRKFGLDITCVKLSPYELSNGTIALDSTVLIPLPEAKEFMMQVERKENPENRRTVTQAEYIKYYSELIELIKKKLPLECDAPIGKGYYQFPTGIGSVHYEWIFHGRPRGVFGVELHLEKGNRELNRQIINKLDNVINKLEQALGEKVIVQKEWGKVWSRLYIQKQEGKMTPELKEWAVDKMVVMIKLLQPVFEEIKRS